MLNHYTNYKMEQLNQKKLKKMFEVIGKGSEVAFIGKKIKILRKASSADQVVNVISVQNKSFFTDSADKKDYFVEFNDYLLIIPEVEDNKNVANLKDMRIYNIATGERIFIQPEVFTKEQEECYVGKLVVIDNQLFVICNAKEEPHFFCILNDTLKAIPLLTAEQILRNQRHNKATLKTLNQRYSKDGWSWHNGILINPENMSVPCLMHYEFRTSLKKRTTPAMFTDIDLFQLHIVLTRSAEKENPAIKLIKSSIF